MTDLERKQAEMFYQNMQIKESMEIERAHAKKERAENMKRRAEDKESINTILE